MLIDIFNKNIYLNEIITGILTHMTNPIYGENLYGIYNGKQQLQMLFKHGLMKDFNILLPIVH